jgi:hypothetical protein
MTTSKNSVPMKAMAANRWITNRKGYITDYLPAFA